MSATLLERCLKINHSDPFNARALGESAAQRRERYRQFLQASIPGGEWQLIREAVQRGQLTGRDRFIDKVEEILGKRIEKKSPGRPPKKIDPIGRVAN